MKLSSIQSLFRAIGLVALFAIPIAAEVTASSDQGFETGGFVEISAPSGRVFQAMAGEIGHWWDPEHTFSGDSTNLSLDATVGGCFCERLPGGGGVRHLTVLHVDSGRLLRLEGGLGPLQELAVTGVMSWALSDVEGGTVLQWTYAVSGFRAGGLKDWASPVDGVVGDQMKRLERYLETGRPSGEQP